LSEEREGVTEETTLDRAEERLTMGDNWEALRLFLEVIEEDPENSHAINKAGVAYARMGEMEHAEQCFYDAVIIDPKFAPALSNLGNVFLDRGENQVAIALYKKALKYDPDYSVAHNNIAAAYKREGQVDKQVSHFKRSQRIMALGRSRDPAEDMMQGSDDRDRGGVRGVGRRFGCLGGSFVLVSALTLIALALL